MGRIGAEVAKRALGFDMRVLYYDTYRREDLEQRHGYRYVDLETLLRESDFVTLHVDLNPSTYHLISTEQFALMKPTAHLINAARGPIVDPKALYEALRSGKIAGAALDVTEPEPIPPDDPLLTQPNCIIVPHIASASVATRTRMATLAAENILNVLAGRPAVTPIP
jgi:glyoxylate reductase